MQVSHFKFMLFVLTTLSGCGTFHNLKDPPTGPMFIGAGCCYPFGGTVRSGILAFMGPPYGLVEIINGNNSLLKGEFRPGFEQIGHGMLMTATGLGAIVDTPFSLAGDIVSFPIAYARSREYPWATWWGEKSMHVPKDSIAPMPEEGIKRIDRSIEKSD